MKLKLEELVTVVGGGTPDREVDEYWNGDIPWISVKDFKASLISTSLESITERGLNSSASRLIPAGNVILPTRMALGKVAINLMDVAINQDLKALLIKDDSKLNLNYLFYFIKSNEKKIISHGKGATVKGITIDVLKDLDLDLPELNVQQKIASALAEADALIQKRNEAIAKMDGLVESVFIEMFGDPISNPYGLDTFKFGEILKKIESGWSPTCDDKPAKEGEWGVLKLSSVTKGVYVPRENKKLLPGTESDSKIEVNEGDLLFTRKNTKDLVGACAYAYVTPRQLMMPDTIFRFQFMSNADVEKLFIWGLFNNKRYKKLVIQKLAEGSAGSMPNISKKKLENMQLILPPIELQQKFSQYLKDIQILKTNMKQQLVKLEENFQSLLHQAFTGRLQCRDSKVDDYALKR
ncbi:restriction endonuclease subunit S [Paenibacillus sinopodophylli]|uniref:restriction endonuclease subunit S n=1 Tax=Paenibacillus sinopodophylli TaxID=1837342 RepID=UPI00110CC84D|nr:restriction endonuclease subunit S [Paenibacillus sinopodophylli]